MLNSLAISYTQEVCVLVIALSLGLIVGCYIGRFIGYMLRKYIGSFLNIKCISSDGVVTKKRVFLRPSEYVDIEILNPNQGK